VVLGKAMAMWQLTFARTGEASGAVVGNGQCVGWARMAGAENRKGRGRRRVGVTA
jgi:hypothetical protein